MTTAPATWRVRQEQLREAKARMASLYYLLTGMSLVLDEYSVPHMRRLLKEAQDTYRPYEVMRYYYQCKAHGYECQGHTTMGKGLHGEGWSYRMAWLILEDNKRDPEIGCAEMLLDGKVLYRWKRDDGYSIPDTLLVVYEELKK